MYSLLKTVCASKPFEKLLVVGGEEWSRGLLLCALKEHYATSFDTISIETLQGAHAGPSLFTELNSSYQYLETASFGKKEADLFLNYQGCQGRLVWCVDGITASVPGALHFPSCKPWEKDAKAREAIRFLLEQRSVVPHPVALQLLSHSALSAPKLFSSDIDRFCHYALEGDLKDADIQSLIGFEATPTMWALLEAFLFRNKKAFFEGLALQEKQGEFHPLPFIRFFRSQIEKFLVAGDNAAALPFKSQEKQKEALKAWREDSKRSLVYELLRVDKELRDGTFEDTYSLVPFFATLWSRMA